MFVLLLLFGLPSPVNTSHNSVVTLIRLQRDLLDRLEALLLHSLDLLREDGLGRSCRVDAAGLDRDHAVTADLQEVLGVDPNDTGLVGLGDIRKDGVDHGDEHPVLVGVTGILDDGDDVGTLLRHVEELTAGAVGELNGVDSPGGPDKVGNVRDGGARGGAEVENLGARAHPDVADTAGDGSTEFGTEGIPYAVFLLLVGLRLYIKKKNNNKCEKVNVIYE